MMSLKAGSQNIIIKRSTMLAAAPIFFLVLLALWTIVNTRVDSADSKLLTNEVFEMVKQEYTNPSAAYHGIDLSNKGTTLSLIERYDDAKSDDTAALASDERCFSVSEDISPTLPEQSQWN